MLIPTGPFTLHRDHPLARGLLGAWCPAAHPNRALVADLLTNRHARVSAGTPAIHVSRYGYGMLYAGGNGHNVSGYFPVTGSAARTTAVWVYVTAADWRMLWWGDTGAGERWLMWFNAASKFALAVNSGYALYNTALSLNALYHFVAVLPASGSATDDVVLYINGQSVATTVSSRVLNTQATGTPFTLGQTGGGQLYDARVWNRALTASEVWNLYNPATRWDLYTPSVTWQAARLGNPWYQRLQQVVTA